MTKSIAQQICQLAQRCYGDQVTASIHTDSVYGRQVCSVVLEHKKLNRRVSFVQAQDWQPLKEAWSAALEVIYA